MQKLINVHCHLLNFDFIPDNYFKSRSPFREWMLRHKLTSWITRFGTIAWPGNKYDRMHEIQLLMKKDVKVVAEALSREMKEAGIVMTTPLMMDLELASDNQKPEIPYRYQVMKISEIAAQYPGFFMPFIMFDPRRRSAAELVITALEKYGFLGVKMYPPLGYHPDPDSFFNPAEVNQELATVYEYCQENQIPITTHCCRGGAYSQNLIKCPELIHKYTNPINWQRVLKRFPELLLNFAHFGGDEEIVEPEKEDSWTRTICQLLREYENTYADLAYHSRGLEQKTREKYFAELGKLLQDETLNRKIIFGTDWSMTRHTWTEAEYVKPFREVIMPEFMAKVGFANPRRFLFPSNQFPTRIIDFYLEKNINLMDLFPKIKNNLEIELYHANIKPCEMAA